MQNLAKFSPLALVLFLSTNVSAANNDTTSKGNGVAKEGEKKSKCPRCEMKHKQAGTKKGSTSKKGEHGNHDGHHH